MKKHKWELKGVEFVNCNCDYGCPCQFNALPTHGHCRAVGSFKVESGYHGSTKLDDLNVIFVGMWPGPIHEGKGEAQLIIDKKANAEQREALRIIFSGEDTESGATIWNVFSNTIDKMHDAVYSDIRFNVDVDKREASVEAPGFVSASGTPIVNPITGKTHRARIDLPSGFEYRLAEVGSGTSSSTCQVAMDLKNSYGQFAKIHWCDSGVLN